MVEHGKGKRKNVGRAALSFRERAARAESGERYQQSRAVWPDISSYGKSKPAKVIIYVLNLFGPNRFLSTLLIGWVLWIVLRYIGRVLWLWFAH